MKLFFLLLFIPFCAEAAKIEQSLKNPILLIHGATMGGSTLQVGIFHLGEYFQGIPQFLSQAKTKVYVVDLPPDSSIEANAAILKSYLELQHKGEKVNIIAHSLGGLDARYLASVLQSPQVLSITTIATPHRGTPLANWGKRQLDNKTGWYYFFRLLGYNLAGRNFLNELTTGFMQNTFNPKVPDRSDVKYFSVVAVAEPWTKHLSPLLYILHYWSRGEGMTELDDGLVPESSQAWGKVLGHLSMDHLSEMGHDTLRFYSTRAETEALYSLIYENLAKEGL